MKGIYAIYRKSDDKCMYVGQSTDIEARINNHLSTKFNKDDYYHKVLEEDNNFSQYDLHNKETYWISELKPLLNKNKIGYQSKDYPYYLKTKELYMLYRDNECYYFTTFNKAAKYINKQRTQLEYYMLHNKPIDGWTISIIDGGDIMYKYIDPEPHDGYKALLQEMKDRNLL